MMIVSQKQLHARFPRRSISNETVGEAPRPSLLSARAEELLTTSAQRIGGPVPAARLWEQVLTPFERQRLGGELPPVWCQLGTVGIWQKLRGVSPKRAVVEVAAELGLLEPLSIWNTRLSPPPLTVTPAAGPMMVSVPVLSLSSSWPLFSVIVNWNNDVRILAVKTGELKQRLRGHAGAITSLVFSQDGRTLVSGSEDGTLRLWESRTGDLRSTFTGHGGPVMSVAISPGGAAVASCSLDQTVRVWRAATEAEVNRKNQEEGPAVIQRGQTQILLGSWKPAAAEFARALDLLTPGTDDWHEAAYRLAFLLASAGETEKYQALCRRTLRDFQQTTNVRIAERTSTMCLITGSAQDPEVLEPAGRFADFAIAHIDGAIASKAAPDWLLGFIQHAKGIAEYRRGNYASALDWFAKSVPGMGKEGKADWIVWCQATDLFFSAMAAHRLGKTEDAHRWLAEAHRLIGTTSRANNTDWLMMDLVRRETEALVTGKNTDSRK
jgi:tetratricopeptide (TPR) repeat protein